MVAIIIIVIIFAVRSCGAVFGFTSGVTRSTEKRDKLDSKYVNYSNTWYEDELGWFGKNNNTDWKTSISQREYSLIYVL